MAVIVHKLYSITIFGYKKEGMDEQAYHDYVATNHADHLKALLAKNSIVSYHMIVFKNIADYLRVRADPHFMNVVGPDHANFADDTRTSFVTGWFEHHVVDGKVVS